MLSVLLRYTNSYYPFGIFKLFLQKMYHWIIDKSSTTCSNSGAGTGYSSGVHGFSPGFCLVRVAQSSVFCIVCCKSLFVVFPFPVAIALSVFHRFTASDFPAGILSLLLPSDNNIYTAIVLFEQSKCIDSIFTSDKRSLTVYSI